LPEAQRPLPVAPEREATGRETPSSYGCSWTPRLSYDYLCSRNSIAHGPSESCKRDTPAPDDHGRAEWRTHGSGEGKREARPATLFHVRACPGHRLRASGHHPNGEWSVRRHVVER